MINLLIISRTLERASKLSSELAKSGLACAVVPDLESAVEKLGERAMDLVLLYGMGSGSEIGRLSQTIRQRWCLPIIVLLPRDAIPALDSIPSIDDFVVAPGDPIEVSLRVKRILRNATALEEHEVIQSGDLVIDTAKCEVSVGGSVVPLTFKEYELLRLLASHKGRVLTRQVLLSKLWGDQYYGGDRTVDVHIRRLRSKIEDQQNTFIVTVRNVGYKFKPAG